MFRSSLVFLLLAVVLHCTVARNANSGEYPAQVAIYMPGNRFGEGVVLNRNHVLTVASNVFDNTAAGLRLSPSAITIRAGAITISATAPPLLFVASVFAHEEYNRFTLQNNIAVLRMMLDFNFEPNNPMPFLNAAVMRNRIVPDATNCQIVGWNAPPANNVLQVIVQPVMNRNTCNSQIPNPVIQGRVSDRHMCIGAATANPAACNNNPGAGYYCNNQLVGLLSSGRQCNTANSPGIVLQTRYYTEWIARQFTRQDNPAPGAVSPPNN